MSCPPARDLSIIQFFIGKWPEVVRVMCERVGGVDSPITDGSESSSSGDIEEPPGSPFGPLLIA